MHAFPMMQLVPLIEDDPVIRALARALLVVDGPARDAFVKRLFGVGEYTVWVAVCRRLGIRPIQPVAMVEDEPDVDALVKVLRVMDWVARHEFLKRVYSRGEHAVWLAVCRRLGPYELLAGLDATRVGSPLPVPLLGRVDERLLSGLQLSGARPPISRQASLHRYFQVMPLV